MGTSIGSHAAKTPDRRRYQREVEALLETIRARVADVERLRAYGVRAAGLTATKRELAQARARLAEVVRHGVAGRDGLSVAQ